MENNNDIDQLFKNGLSEPDIPFNELDWEKMERKLDAKDKKRILPLWMFSLSGVAAALAVIVLWFFSKPQETGQKTADKTAINSSKIKAPVSTQNPAPENFNKAVQEPLTVNPYPDSGTIKTADQLRIETSSGKPLITAVDEPMVSHPAAAEGLTKSGQFNLYAQGTALTFADQGKKGNPVAITSLHQSDLPQRTDSASIIAAKANALAQSRDPLEGVKPYQSDPGALSRSIRKNMEAALANNHGLTLTAMAAPDVSTAKSSKSSKLSSNVGMLATYALGKKISVTSGAVYAKKYYNSTGTTTGNYGAAANNWEVYADCNVLDIPLNVNYKVLGGKKLSVSINTGLSSYFMLKEKYDYVTDQPNGTQKVSTLEISNQNQHLLGVANVAVSFDHQLSDHLSVGLQPFAKLPLTGIGYGDASLKSLGLSFSLNIGLFPAKKTGKYAALR